MRIFLAGTAGESRNKEDVKRSPYILESFVYFKPWQTELLHTTKDFLLDSGAFTFIQNTNNVNWNEYIERYADFIKEHAINHWFELDIDSIVGYDKVKEYRKRLEKLIGKQAIPVWHRGRGLREYERHCDEYKYVAVGGLAIKEIKRSEYDILPVLLSKAHKKGTMVHGLGFTNVTLLQKYHFDSVDSTRWNCARFGRMEYFDGKTMKVVDRRNENYRLKGRSSDKNIIQFTLNEWIKFQYYAEKHL